MAETTRRIPAATWSSWQLDDWRAVLEYPNERLRLALAWGSWRDRQATIGGAPLPYLAWAMELRDLEASGLAWTPVLDCVARGGSWPNPQEWPRIAQALEQLGLRGPSGHRTMTEQLAPVAAWLAQQSDEPETAPREGPAPVIDSLPALLDEMRLAPRAHAPLAYLIAQHAPALRIETLKQLAQHTAWVALAVAERPDLSEVQARWALARVLDPLGFGSVVPGLAYDVVHVDEHAPYAASTVMRSTSQRIVQAIVRRFPDVLRAEMRMVLRCATDLGGAALSCMTPDDVQAYVRAHSEHSGRSVLQHVIRYAATLEAPGPVLDALQFGWRAWSGSMSGGIPDQLTQDGALNDVLYRARSVELWTWLGTHYGYHPRVAPLIIDAPRACFEAGAAGVAASHPREVWARVQTLLAEDEATRDGQRTSLVSPVPQGLFEALATCPDQEVRLAVMMELLPRMTPNGPARESAPPTSVVTPPAPPARLPSA